jgi:hypothetical protein
MNSALALLDTAPASSAEDFMRRLGWLSVVTLLAACPSDKSGEKDAGPVDVGPMQLTEKEPNDRPEQALLITGSSVVSANLSADPSKVDEDWYLLSSPKAQVVDLTVSGIPGGDVALEILDADKNRLAAVNSEGVDKGERLPNLYLKDKAYVKVTSAKKGAGGAYKLTATFSAPVVGFEAEPNDRAVDATAALLGQSVSGYVGHAGDEDWYRFELPAAAAAAVEPAPVAPASEDAGEDAGAAGEAPVDAGPAAETPKIALKIELTAVEGVRFDLSVLSEAEAPLFHVAGGKEGDAISVRNVGVRATDKVIYLVVKSAWTGAGKDAKRSYNPSLPYTLAVEQEEAGASAEYEPNDDLMHATPLPKDGYREGFLSPKSDLDYYVLKTDEPVLAKVQLSGVERLDLTLSLVKASDKPGGAEVLLMKANDGAVKEPESLNNVLCAGECYFKVEGTPKKVDGKWVRDYENSVTPYRLTISVVPDNGSEEREPNNTPETATPLAMGQPVRGTIHPKKDVDYYKLDLSARVVKTAIKATVTGILKVDIGLYLHSLGADGKLSLQQTADRAKGEAPEVIHYSAEPGVYILEVRDAKNREANFQDSYQLTVEEGE